MCPDVGAGPGDYDALLVVSFGGPEGPEDVLPFLENVTRGRNVPRERLVEVGAHYAHFGGVSPINAQNRALVAAIRGDLASHGIEWPVFWGNRNWAPYLDEAIEGLAARGARRVLCFVTSAYSSYSGCRQYRENLAAASARVAERGIVVPELVKLRTYFDHPGFIEPFVDATVAALADLPQSIQRGAPLVFTTHSIPVSQAQASGPTGGAYVDQHLAAAELVSAGVAQRTGVPDRAWDLVYQSRSGSPRQPWLEPDVGDHLESLSSSGVEGAVIVPVGFVSDHVEVLWDLDEEAASRAERLGLVVRRAATPGIDPRFVAMVRELVLERTVGAPRRALSSLGPSWDVCAEGCCLNARSSVPGPPGRS